MRLLCDRNVDDKYYQVFHQADWITVRRLRDVLSIDASDPAIIDYAADQGWVVFTSDVRFLAADRESDVAASELDAADCGIVFYRQAENPAPGDVLAALGEIAKNYDDTSEIREYVPGNWL